MQEIMQNILPLIVLLVASYCIGSIPFGLLLVRASGKGDIRTSGSGNIGATNVLRHAGKKLGFLTFLLDALKGFLAVIGAAYFFPQYAALSGLAAFLGHVFPIWLRFKGGKGIATAFGVIAAFMPFAAGITAIIWLLVAVITRYSSLAGLISFSLLPIYGFFIAGTESFLLSVPMLVIIIIRHQQNIKNLYAGTEGKLGRKSP